MPGRCPPLRVIFLSFTTVYMLSLSSIYILLPDARQILFSSGGDLLEVPPNRHSFKNQAKKKTENENDHVAPPSMGLDSSKKEGTTFGDSTQRSSPLPAGENQDHQEQPKVVPAVKKMATATTTTTTITSKNEPNEEEKTSQDKKDRLKTLKRLLEVGNLNIETYIASYSVMELPPWSQIEHRYGAGPTILGLDTCEEYRTIVPTLFERWVAPTGLFHSGTNLIASLMAEGCVGYTPQFQVPWGKHNPITARDSDHRAPKKRYQEANITKVMPIVMVRHPIDWMPSMCRQPYAASFNRSATGCPGLGETDVTVKLYEDFPYPDLLRYWMAWNRPYLLLSSSEEEGEQHQSPQFPRLVVRLEDLVFYPKETLQQLCTCVGGFFRPEALATLHDRQGGDGKAANGKLQMVESWKRHGDISLQSVAENNQKVIKSVLSTDDGLQSMLDVLNYKLD